MSVVILQNPTKCQPFISVIDSILLQNISPPQTTVLIGTILKFWIEKTGSTPTSYGRAFSSKRRTLHCETVIKDCYWRYRPHIMDASDWRLQGQRRSIMLTPKGFPLMRTCATCRKFKVCEFSPSGESLFEIIQILWDVFYFTPRKAAVDTTHVESQFS